MQFQRIHLARVRSSFCFVAEHMGNRKSITTHDFSFGGFLPLGGGEDLARVVARSEFSVVEEMCSCDARVLRLRFSSNTSARGVGPEGLYYCGRGGGGGGLHRFSEDKGERTKLHGTKRTGDGCRAVVLGVVQLVRISFVQRAREPSA